MTPYLVDENEGRVYEYDKALALEHDDLDLAIAPTAPEALAIIIQTRRVRYMTFDELRNYSEEVIEARRKEEERFKRLQEWATERLRRQQERAAYARSHRPSEYENWATSTCGSGDDFGSALSTRAIEEAIEEYSDNHDPLAATFLYAEPDPQVIPIPSRYFQSHRPSRYFPGHRPRKRA